MSRELFTLFDKTRADLKGFFKGEEVLVLGDIAYVDLYAMRDDGSQTAIVAFSPGLTVFDYSTRTMISDGDAVDMTQLLAVVATQASASASDRALSIEFRKANGARTWTATIAITALELAFYADFDRDGVLDKAPNARGKWTWGASGYGAVLLVNSDRDTAHPNRRFRDRLDRRINGPLDLDDMTQIALRLSGPSALDLRDFSVRLHVSDAAASRVRIFDIGRILPEAIVGPGIPTAIFPPQQGDTRLALEGLDYPDAGFSGLLTITAELERSGKSYGGDAIVLRVAPWLALPNTQPATRLYIAEMQDGSNSAAIKDIKKLAAAAKVELVIVPPKVNREDRWLQDEIEIGCAARPGKVIPVVLDSPRNRQLDEFPERMLLGPDFGYVTRGNDGEQSSLDSFGNLDCTPPHAGPKGDYPFGRIIFGGAQPGANKGRRMMKVVADFMYAQQVQFPIELYSDWLTVGHIDEFMSFVPAPDRQQFRLVLAKPALAYEILQGLAAAGKGKTRMLKGKRYDTTVDGFLKDDRIRKQNEIFQAAIDWNKAVLIREMGLQPADIVHVPALYKTEGGDGRAGAYFPGMVNMQVVNGHLAIPKPFGPVVSGRCVFEQHALDTFGKLGLTCHFVDTYEGYHLQMGEIHCGTNVVRRPFPRDWWHFDPGVNAAEIAEMPMRSNRRAGKAQRA